MNVGILGAGGIASTMATTVNMLHENDHPEIVLWAVGSRSMDKAQEFADRFGIPKAYGTYEELAADPDVDLIYIATPHSHHFDHMKLCIMNHKPVLCEKAFTTTAKKAREIIALARQEKVYLAEALWPRYMPSRKMINDIVASGVVGKINMVTCNLAYDIDHVERMVRPELAGGVLLDLGVYGLNFLTMHVGKNIEKIDSTVIMTPTGVDGMENITITFDNGMMGVTNHSMFARSDRKGIFYGEKGYIIVENINNPGSIDVFNSNDELLAHYEVPKQHTGYEYEVIEAMHMLEAGKTESDSMPLEESIYMMELMDRVRATFNK